MNPAPRTAAAVAFALFFAWALAWQWLQGSWHAGFAGHPDEGGHVVTGLFVRDAGAWLLSGGLSGGIPAASSFARTWYEAYPKIGLGVWPPVFYLIQAAWTTLFGESRTALLLLMAALSAALSLLTASIASRWTGRAWGFATGLLAGALPILAQYAAMVMTEIPVALLQIAAATCFASYLQTGRVRRAWAFGILAALAILTKGTGLALALFVPIALILTGRWSALRHKTFWASGILVALVAGPWTYKTQHLGHGGWLYSSPCIEFTSQAIPYYTKQLCVALGPVLLALATLGFVAASRSRHRVFALSLLAFPIAVLVFQCIAPVGLEARHLAPAAACLCPFAVVGAKSLFHRKPLAGWAAAIVLALAAFLEPVGPSHFGAIGNRIRISPFRISHKIADGFEDAAAWVFANGKRRILVSSDASGEGAIIAAMALHDPLRPSYTAARASKTLSESAWRGRDYKPKFDSADAVRDALEAGGFDAVLVDRSLPESKRRTHHALLEEIAATSENVTIPVRRAPGPPPPPLLIVIPPFR